MKVLPEEHDGCERLHGWNITGASDDDVGVAAFVIAGPLPDPNTGRAVLNGCIHVKPLWGRLFAGDDNIYIIATS